MASSLLRPYPHELLPNSAIYRFVTAQGVQYVAYFASAAGYFPTTSFADNASVFSVFPDEYPPELVGFDARVGATIADIVKRYLAMHPQALICYICDQVDARAFKRAMRFARLFEQGNTAHAFEKIDIVQPPLYGAVLFRRDHPARAEIKQAAIGLGDKLLGDKLSDEEE